MPLVHARGRASRPASERRRARKIKPEYAEGALVKVARASNLLQGRAHRGAAARGGDPQHAAWRDAGYAPILARARDVLVPESGPRRRAKRST